MTDERKEINESAATEAASTATEAVVDTGVAVETEEPPYVEALKAEAAKAKEYLDKLLRTAADFENYKKRAARERQEAVKFANEGIINTLLPVLDNFEMALAATTGAQDAAIQSLQSGISMIYQQLKKALADAGVEEVDAANQTFDPNFHEAVSQQETADVPEGRVVQQLRKGYKLRDRLLRPASVVVAKKPSK
jgi:molecular chaperone GrpE